MVDIEKPLTTQRWRRRIVRLDPSQLYRAVEVMKFVHFQPHFQLHNSVSGRSLDEVISKGSFRIADA